MVKLKLGKSKAIYKLSVGHIASIKLIFFSR